MQWLLLKCRKSQFGDNKNQPGLHHTIRFANKARERAAAWPKFKSNVAPVQLPTNTIMRRIMGIFSRRKV